MKQEQGIKFDDKKLSWLLLPWNPMRDVVRVLEYGARKYAPDNWKHVKPKERYIDAAFRHLIARAAGEISDDETGLPHAAHAVCCLLFLMWHDSQEP